MILAIPKSYKNNPMLIAVYFIIVILTVYVYLYSNMHSYIIEMYLTLTYNERDAMQYNGILKQINIFQNYLFSNYNDKTSLSAVSYLNEKMSMQEVSSETNLLQILLYDSNRCGIRGAFHFI